MELSRIWSSDKSMKASTGLTLAEAQELLHFFSVERASQRAQPVGPGGRPECLDDQGIFTLTLIHYRHYLGFEMLGLMFSISCSSAKRIFDECDELIRLVLKKRGFYRLIAPNRPRRSVESLNSNARSISMALNNR